MEPSMKALHGGQIHVMSSAPTSVGDDAGMAIWIWQHSIVEIIIMCLPAWMQIQFWQICQQSGWLAATRWTPPLDLCSICLILVWYLYHICVIFV